MLLLPATVTIQEARNTRAMLAQVRASKSPRPANKNHLTGSNAAVPNITPAFGRAS